MLSWRKLRGPSLRRSDSAARQRSNADSAIMYRESTEYEIQDGNKPKPNHLLHVRLGMVPGRIRRCGCYGVSSALRSIDGPLAEQASCLWRRGIAS
jgi:hypothetical protein